MTDNIEPRVRYECGYCGSTDVTRDAATIWNVDEQRWEIGTDLYDTTQCVDCGSEDIQEVRLDGLRWLILLSAGR